MTHLAGLVKEWHQSSEAGHNGFQEVHIFLSPVQRLLKHLEGLGHQQAHLSGLLADHPQHQEGARLQRRIVVERSPKDIKTLYVTKSEGITILLQ